MHSRRPLPALALVLPHPPLPNCAPFPHFSGALSPRTPRACSPSTPVLLPTQLIASPRTSIDSWGSSNGAGDDEVQWEWKSEQMSLLVSTLDTLPGHLFTPFNGPVPPSNLLDKIARSVSQSQGPLEWPHSVRATRAKLAEIARAHDKGRSKENMTIDEREENEIMEVPLHHKNSKRPLYRQSSMDFLPSKNKASGNLSRLSSRLQRTDRMITAYHPYPRPVSRSSSPRVLTPCSDSPSRTFLPKTPVFSPFLPTIRCRTSSTSLGSCPPPSLRRSISAMSTHSNPVQSSTLSGPPSTGTLSLLKRGGVHRSDSFSCVVPIGPTLKRAPSFGATSLASAKGVCKHVPKEKQVQEPETDDEEKEREKNVKRPRTRSTTTVAGDPEKKKRSNKEKKVQGQKEIGATPASSPTKAKPRPKTTRSGSMFGAELPQPQMQRTLPSEVASLRTPSTPSPSSPGSTPKTLRRIKTTTFNLASCPSARRISFSSLAPPAEEPNRDNPPTTALGSAFQLS